MLPRNHPRMKFVDITKFRRKLPDREDPLSARFLASRTAIRDGQNFSFEVGVYQKRRCHRI
jgi:hypothetical protein